MTDLAVKPGDGADPGSPETDAAGAAPTVISSTPETSGEPRSEYAWAPAPPAERRSHRLWWIVGGAGALAIALVAASLVLIAPGTSAAGVPVGLLPQGAAAGAVQARLDATSVTIDGQTLSARDLGASVDATAAADAAHAAHPLWNPASWFQGSTSAQVSIDPAVATAERRRLVPDLYADAADAAVTFDAASASYTVTPGVEGEQVDLAALQLALQSAFDAGETEVAVTPTGEPVIPAADTDEASATADRLNGMLGSIGFYIGDERTVPIDPATAASWLTVTADDEAGDFVITASAAKIQTVVDTLPGLVNRQVVNGTVITNSAGEYLTDVTAGADGRTLGSVATAAKDFAAQLATGDPAYALTVTTVPAAVTTLYRHIDVSISQQTATLYENGAVVATYLVSTGLPGTPTPTGDFTVFAHVPMQDMGCQATSSYCTQNVPWVTYFAPDIGFHGAYWHNNFGNEMSHGCVNMPIDVAQFVYDWSPEGMEVSVHD